MGKVPVIGSAQTAEFGAIEVTALKMTGGYSSAFELKNLITSSGALSGATAAVAAIPADCIVLAVDTVVTTALAGASGYSVGDGTDADLWGTVSATAIGTKLGMADYTTATANVPLFKTAAANVTLTALTSNFTAGVIQVSVWYLQSTGPRAL